MRVDVRGFWDRLYAQHPQVALNDRAAWLEPWRSFLERSSERPILDLGCGTGSDSRYLTRHGFRVIAVDQSGEALKITYKLSLRGGA